MNRSKRDEPRYAWLPVATLCGVCMTGAWGCSGQDLNDRPVLGGAQRIAALHPCTAHEPETDQPSLQTVNRTEWSPRRFLVPVDGTVHKPIRRLALTAASGNPRRTGLWPTLESSLLITAEPDGELVLEGLIAWIEALGELKLLGYEIVLSPAIGKEGLRASPWAMYKRYPETGEWTNASAADQINPNANPAGSNPSEAETK